MKATADVLRPWATLHGPPPPSSPAGRALVASAPVPPVEAEDEDWRWYRESLADEGHPEWPPRRGNGQRARVFMDLDSELQDHTSHREARLVLAMHRQKLVTTEHAQQRLAALGFDMGVPAADDDDDNPETFPVKAQRKFQRNFPPTSSRTSPLRVGSLPLRRPDLPTRLAWAVVWRAAVLAGFCLALAWSPTLRPDALVGAVILLPLGLLLRIGHRLHPLACLWRLALIAAAVTALGGTGRWPFVVMAAAGWPALEGVAAAVRPLRRSGAGL